MKSTCTYSTHCLTSLRYRKTLVCITETADEKYQKMTGLAPKIEFISLPINLNMCFGCSKEPSH